MARGAQSGGLPSIRSGGIPLFSLSFICHRNSAPKCEFENQRNRTLKGGMQPLGQPLFPAERSSSLAEMSLTKEGVGPAPGLTGGCASRCTWPSPPTRQREASAPHTHPTWHSTARTQRDGDGQGVPEPRSPRASHGQRLALPSQTCNPGVWKQVLCEGELQRPGTGLLCKRNFKSPKTLEILDERILIFFFFSRFHIYWSIKVCPDCWGLVFVGSGESSKETEAKTR